MPFLEKAWSNITEKVSEHFEKKRREQEEFENMKRQADFQHRIEQEQEEKQRTFEDTKKLAYERAEKETGIRKLRALNRAERLSQNPNSFFTKLSQHTQKNLQRSAENKQRSQMIRACAQKMRQEEMERRQQERLVKMNRRK